MGLKKAYDELEITNGPLELNENDIRNVGEISGRRFDFDIVDDSFAYQVGGDETISGTISRAIDDGVSHVTIPTGSYDESSITIPRGFRLSGTAPDQDSGVRIDGSSEDAILIFSSEEFNRSTVTHLSVRQNGDGDNFLIAGGENTLAFCGCGISADLRVQGDNNRIIGNNMNGSNVILENGADNNVVIGNTDVGTIEDNGTGNQVGFNS